ncbi:MAG: sulfotransferase [Pseudomonadota bacterium]
MRDDERTSPVLRVLDKQPLNFWHLGLVAMALPNARVIHCTRDARDNGLSILAENFTPKQRWATDPDDVAHYRCGYLRLMNYWREATGLRILDVAYEDTVADLEGQARHLLGFLDLPFEPDVLAFHERAAPVQTPSRWQVRRPLYASSVGRWRAYEGNLGDFEAAEA